MGILHYNKSDLPFNDSMLRSWENDGFLIINNFYSDLECETLKNQANYLVKNFDYQNHQSVFNTNKQNKVKDDYFLESGDKIRFFFEENSFKENGELTNDIEFLINKIGHAMHDLDPIFINFSHKKELDDIAKGIKINNPLLVQSMYIFKQPRIGGEVICHQDSTFLYTIPDSVVGFWIAIEDANIENGCMWADRGGHKEPLRKLFKRKNNILEMETIDKTPFKELTTPLEVDKGTLILLHGRLPHYSTHNKSLKSRHAYTMHVINGEYTYPSFNWLQRPANFPFKGFIN
ncbi:MAG: hypothetical protein CFH19_00465 [Alphaproteobacteria bacterium MarineAlpha5_Bin9]|nr:MAG: hypothetical protein CFH19_00465 [Alphaproteobacteria bacterium MarineAlpha5_Bin9]|tara:strand:+ start:9031 stop:9900 length:870 start_codon:yes stop_codon:yes gene_type:complete